MDNNDVKFKVLRNIYWDNWGHMVMVFRKDDICNGKLYDDGSLSAESPYYDGISDCVGIVGDGNFEIIQTKLNLAKIPIEDMDLSVRGYNCLKRAHINYVSQIAEMSKNDLENIRNIGKKAPIEIIEKMLNMYGITIED